MSAGTGENEMGLRKILDFTRLGSIVILLLHFYYYCYGVFKLWRLTAEISDRFLVNISHTGLFNSIFTSKLMALVLLAISLLGSRGKKEEKISKQSIAFYLISGLAIFLTSTLLLNIKTDIETLGIIYMVVTGVGFLFILAGGNLLTRFIKLNLGKDIFNELNETFPQEERLLENEYSINLPAQYNLKGKVRKSWINIINPFRGLLVSGSPGSGKSYFVIQHIIKQHIKKGFTMLVYDFKYDDLTKIAYNVLLKNKRSYKVIPSFYSINFDDLSKSNRCNPLDHSTMFDITDATEASRSIMMGLNKDWITKQGDFFVESPINFVTAIIWFLKKYKSGKYCTLPHVIELMQIDYEKLFSVLRTEAEIEVLINPFISAYQNNAMEQLEGQVASAKIGMARLSSPQLYWVLSANDFTLDINNPDSPKIICLANNPQKQQIYGAVLSLYVTRLIKLVNQKNRLKSSLIFDEFPTIYFNDIDSLIATARSNKVATCLGIQDFSQLKKDYGADQSAVIMNITGNIISGQVTGETSKFLSERFGKINQVKESISINRTDTSVSKSSQLDFAIPQSKISGLSSGEFVGMVADDPTQKIKLKTFHCEIMNNHEQLKAEADLYKELPVISKVTVQMVNENFMKIKKEVIDIIETEIERILNTPGLENIMK
ncbi:conjugal transfer protein TraG [Chitinophagaceae bacterium IBVUCB2]|nr:conjugal transfer protein TraG [Chitinophagaceae bacterium IBVUCB2]